MVPELLLEWFHDFAPSAMGHCQPGFLITSDHIQITNMVVVHFFKPYLPKQSSWDLDNLRFYFIRFGSNPVTTDDVSSEDRVWKFQGPSLKVYKMWEGWKVDVFVVDCM